MSCDSTNGQFQQYDVKRNTDWLLPFQYVDDQMQPLPITGFRFRVQFRPSLDSNSVFLTYDSDPAAPDEDFPITITDDLQGMFELMIPRDKTRIAPDTLYGDVTMISPDDEWDVLGTLKLSMRDNTTQEPP